MTAPIFIATSPEWGQLVVCMVGVELGSHWHRYGNGISIAELADAGRAHLRDHHPEVVWAASGLVYRFEAEGGPEAYVPLPRRYCRAHGVRHSCALTRMADGDHLRIQDQINALLQRVHAAMETYTVDGLMHTPETAPFPREHVEHKWGPLVPVLNPIQTAHRANGARA